MTSDYGLPDRSYTQLGKSNCPSQFGCDLVGGSFDGVREAANKLSPRQGKAREWLCLRLHFAFDRVGCFFVLMWRNVIGGSRWEGAVGSHAGLEKHS